MVLNDLAKLVIDVVVFDSESLGKLSDVAWAG